MRLRRDDHPMAHRTGIDPRALAGCGTTIDVPAGTVLCRTGEPGRQAFVLVEGYATVIGPEGPRAVLGPGDIAGEVAVVEDTPRTADVVCSTDATVLVFSRQEFQALLERDEAFARRVDDLIDERFARAA